MASRIVAVVTLSAVSLIVGLVACSAPENVPGKHWGHRIGPGGSSDDNPQCDPSADNGATSSGGPTPPWACPPPASHGGSSPPPVSVDAGGSGPPVCPHTGPPVIDPATLPSCAPEGGAHCISGTLLPVLAAQFAKCPTGLCVPDAFIASGGEFIAPTCKSTLGVEGRCLGVVIPKVAAQKAELPQDTCKAFERCVPCYDAVDGKATGACTLSCDPGPKSSAPPASGCCNRNGVNEGVCVPTASVPAADQPNLCEDACAKGVSLCVPTEMVAPGFKPTACVGATLLTHQYTGVCLSKCLQFSAVQQLGISQGTCDVSHDCVPCRYPNGQPTAAPGCA